MSVRTRSFATPRTILALMLREMSSRYGQSPGGYVWALMEPLGAIIILTIAFSLIVRSPSLGTSFALFYATGYLPFSQYQDTMNAVARSLSFSRPLMMYPAVTWVDAIVARAVLNTLTGITVTYILLTGVLQFSDTNAVIDLGPILLAVAMSTALGIAVGSVNCFLSGLFPVWELVWSILSRPLFVASGIFFIYEDLPHEIQDVLWFNPLIHVTAEMRKGFYPMYSADFVSPTFVFLLCLVLTALSFLLLRKFHSDILNER